MGVVIGSGIFVSPVGILKHAHSVGFSFILWVLCGLYNLLGAICYAELGTSIPESGGEYTYVKRAFGDLPAFIVLWINFLLICPVRIAALSTIFALYIIKPIYPDCEPPYTPIKCIGSSLICLLIMVNSVNVKWATKVQVVITVSKVAALGTVICIGLYYIGKGDTEHFKDSFEDSDYSAGAIALSFYSGFWAYSGWSCLSFLVDEMVNPQRNLPLAIGISMILVIVFYLMANVAYLAVLSPREMLLTPAVAVTFADSTMGVMRWLMPILIAISVCGTLNGNAIGFSRLFYVGAKNGQFPSVIAMINVKRFTPMPSLIVIMVLSLLFQISPDIFYLIELDGFGFATVLVIVFAAQAYLRFKEPNLPRPIKLPIVLPIFLCLVSILIVILTFVQKPNESFLALGLLAGGVVLYLMAVKWKSKPMFVQEKMSKLTILVQKLLLVVVPDDVV
ncbi:hypothetical protein CHS0354_021228 [Potamilus streckersoni]|uniref:Y+L amino acid transporter 2 n=1 Tax=Potamilus streckersoni TaxID=2493646 RepID=A0AAE0W0Y8_9BIVA|nr:hypothetical protein CHS0354_021228 [Potamilus streckersoni]